MQRNDASFELVFTAENVLQLPTVEPLFSAKVLEEMNQIEAGG